MSLRITAALSGVAGVVLAGACVFSTHGTVEGGNGAGGSAATSMSGSSSSGSTATASTSSSSSSASSSSGAGGSTSSSTSSGAGGSVEPHCTNGTKDGGESDVDCGGPDCKGCDVGQKCKDDAHCANGICEQGVCCGTQCNGACRSCDGQDNGGQNGVCAQANAGLDPGKHCGDQGLGSCDANGQCSCTNGVKDGSETDVDCGGPDCPKCADGLGCGGNADCDNGHCVGPTGNKICCDSDCTGPCYTCRLQPHWVGRCVPVFSGDQGGCPQSQGCSPTHTCSGGFYNGTDCSSNNQCISLSCATGFDSKCHPRGPTGDPCNSQYNCKSGVCLNNHLCQ